MPELGSWKLAVLALLLLICYIISQYFNRGLYNIPGPFFANFSEIWRLWSVQKGDFHITIMRLHEKYGDFVRIGSNTVSIADPNAIKTIYGHGEHFIKSDFYKPFDRYGMPSHIFSVQNEAAHAAMRRPIASAYSMTTLVEYESLVDDCINKFLERLESEYAGDADVSMECDIHRWVQYCG